jgi:MazG family protein
MTQINSLLSIMARLRDKNGGCPWDLEQNFATIAPYTIEEAYEVAEAIAKGDRTELRDELGDLLLQVVFHSQMASEEGSFSFADVVQSICDKMVRRHPHVFSDAEIKTAEAQTANWEIIKEQERAAKKSERTLADVPAALPALMRAQKLQARAARVGFDWPDTRGVVAKIKEELAEVEEVLALSHPERSEESQPRQNSSATPQNDIIKERLTEELGDLLFAVTNLARFVGADAETAVRDTNAKFTRRFEYIEDALKAKGIAIKDASLDDMETLWNEAKRKEKA